MVPLKSYCDINTILKYSLSKNDFIFILERLMSCFDSKNKTIRK
ncbi:MAG: hypothetical protein ACFWTJ_10425 [Lachnoclostridium sp.]